MERLDAAELTILSLFRQTSEQLRVRGAEAWPVIGTLVRCHDEKMVITGGNGEVNMLQDEVKSLIACGSVLLGER